MRTLSLTATANVTLDESGNGTVQLGPQYAGEIWYPAIASVGTEQETVTNEAQCKIYCGPLASQAYYVDGTLSGSTGDSTANVAGQVIRPGSYVWAVWSGGDYLAVATLNVQGSRTVP